MAERNSDPPLRSNEQIRADSDLPRRRAGHASEKDLWNLDGPLPQESELSPEPKTARNTAETIVRIEKGTVNREAKTKNIRKAKNSREVVPHPSNAQSSEAPDPSLPSSTLVPTVKRSPTKSVGPMEDAVWADFDFDEPAAEVTGRALPPKVEEEPAAVLKPDSYRTEPLPQSSTVPQAADSSTTEEIPFAEATTSTEAGTPPEDATSLAFEENAAPTPAKETRRFTRLETITTAVFAALLIAAAVFGIYLFRTNIVAETDPFATADFPVKGAIAQINDAQTYWRAPITEGPNADVIKRDIFLLPVIEITLDESRTNSGVLRVIFYNEKKEIAGDIVTREFRNHRFTQNGAATLSFASSAGFTEFGEEGAYRASLNDPWTIEVYEGPDADAPSASFQLLFKTAISPEKR